MVRSILGVVAGYLAMFVFVFISFTILYLLLGANSAFEPDTYEVSLTWIIISFILSIVAAILGGYLCVLISKNHKAALVLAGIVFVLGIAMAIPVLIDVENEVQEMRKADVPNLEAMQNAKQPPLVALLTPLIGALGVFAGSK
ncbi:MAG: hypothetical protein WAR59_01975, partial [Ignavibacteriaceae bacterium]